MSDECEGRWCGSPKQTQWGGYSDPPKAPEVPGLTTSSRSASRVLTKKPCAHPVVSRGRGFEKKIRITYPVRALGVRRVVQGIPKSRGSIARACSAFPDAVFIRAELVFGRRNARHEGENAQCRREGERRTGHRVTLRRASTSVRHPKNFVGSDVIRRETNCSYRPV